MVDYDSAEITALEEVFPGIEVFLCDFHREQAWSRYVTFFYTCPRLIFRVIKN